MKADTEAVDGTAETVAAAYLRLRCDILDQFDGDMFGRGMAAGAAYGRAEEAFAGVAAAHPEWVRSILLGTLARRDRAAAARHAAEAEGVKRWAAGEAFGALPVVVREWVRRDMRQVEAAGGDAGEKA